MQSSRCRIFEHSECQLGEAAFWHKARESFIWLDILSRQLYEKTLNGSFFKHTLNFTATAILAPQDEFSLGVRLIAENGVYSLDLLSGNVTKLCDIILPEGYRTNDAGLDPDARIVFGVMEWEPTGSNGWISRFERDGTLTQLVRDVGIPNTLAWSTSGDKMYYSDSFEQVMYVADYPQLNISEFFSLKEGLATPDGSCVQGEYLYTAEWDGWRIAKRCLNTGREIAELIMPVPRPTSCAIHDEQILITTAREGLTAKELCVARDSGKTYIAAIEDFVSIK